MENLKNTANSATQLNNKPMSTKNVKLFSFITVFAILLIACIIKNQQDFMYDSWLYWGLGSEFDKTGTFSFLNFPETLRGYFGPFLNYIIIKVSNFISINPVTGFWIANSALISATITFLIPAFLPKKILNLRLFLGSIIFTFVFIYFWGYMLYYPLSDVTALTLFAFSILILLKISNSFNNKKYLSTISYSFIAGFLLYATYNIRTAYQYPILLVLGVFIVFRLIKNYKLAIISTLFITIGFAVVSMPQIQINMQHRGENSPLVATEPYGGSDNLMMFQLSEGISVPRYETYVGYPTGYPSPSMTFREPIGQAIQELEPRPEKVSDMIKLYFKYPLEFVGIYTKHIVNLATPLFSEGYITNLHANKAILFIVNFLIFLTFAIAMFSKKWQLPKNLKNIKELSIYTFLLFIPAILVIPGAVETRFWISIYMLVYAIVCYFVDYKALFEYIKSNWCKIAVLSLALLCLWTSAITSTLGSAVEAKFTFANNTFNPVQNTTSTNP